MKIKIPGILICLMLLFSGRTEAATPNTALTLVEVVGGVLVAVEGINLAVRAIINSRPKKKAPVEKQPVQTNAPVPNLITITNVPVPETNRIISLPATNLVRTNVPILAVTPVTNLIPQPPHTNLITSMTSPTNTNRSPAVVTNLVETNLLSFRPAVLSNMTENEKQDIMLFGRDHYYLVSMAYFRVGKMENSREFMFHSLAIEVRVEEGTKFLKEKFHLSDAEIRAGKAKYLRSRE